MHHCQFSVGHCIALPNKPYVYESTRRFMDSVNRTIAALHPIHCTRERKVQVELDMTTIPAFLVVFAILWFVLRPRRPKPKIN